MSIGFSTALSGVSAANERLRASSSNVLSASTADLRRQQQAEVQQAARDMAPPRPVTAVAQSLESAVTAQKSATYAFVANLRVLQTQMQASGSMLDIHA
jgi:hypothetical protein